MAAATTATATATATTTIPPSQNSASTEPGLWIQFAAGTGTGTRADSVQLSRDELHAVLQTILQTLSSHSQGAKNANADLNLCFAADLSSINAYGFNGDMTAFFDMCLYRDQDYYIWDPTSRRRLPQDTNAYAPDPDQEAVLDKAYGGRAYTFQPYIMTKFLGHRPHTDVQDVWWHFVIHGSSNPYVELCLRDSDSGSESEPVFDRYALPLRVGDAADKDCDPDAARRAVERRLVADPSMLRRIVTTIGKHDLADTVILTATDRYLMAEYDHTGETNSSGRLWVAAPASSSSSASSSTATSASASVAAMLVSSDSAATATTFKRQRTDAARARDVLVIERVAPSPDAKPIPDETCCRFSAALLQNVGNAVCGPWGHRTCLYMSVATEFPVCFHVPVFQRGTLDVYAAPRIDADQ